MLSKECLDMGRDRGHDCAPFFEGFADIGNVTHKIGRRLQIPVGRIDVDVAQIGRQGDHVLVHASST